MHRHGTPALPRRYFEALRASFGDDCEVLTVTTPRASRCRSVLSFYFRDEVLPYYAGDDDAARDLAANDFKYWELMRRACARGLQRVRLRPQQAGHRLVSTSRRTGASSRTPLHYEYRLLQARRRCRRTTRPTPSTKLMIADLAAPAAAAWPTGSGRASCATWAEARWPTLLYLVHRMPYPPNKGDKVRSYHLLRHLAAQHRVLPRHLRRRPATTRPTSTTLRALLRRACTSSRLQPLLRASCAAWRGLLRGEPLTLPTTATPACARWVDADRARAAASTRSSCSPRRWRSTPTAPAALPMLRRLRRRRLGQVDAVRADAPLAAVAGSTGARASGCSPTSARVARAARAASSSPSSEAELFRALAPECAGARRRDRQRRRRRLLRARPGAAVAVSGRRAADRLHRRDGLLAQRRRRDLVRRARCCRAARSAARRCASTSSARSPAPAVQRAGRRRACVVTGTVPDVRPYLQHAAVVVAPLRLARGIQNKVLEAMAMARPVVASRGLRARRSTAEPRREICSPPTTPTTSCAQVGALLRRPGARRGHRRRAARARVLAATTAGTRNLARDRSTTSTRCAAASAAA
ncbi:MAG: GNAT family N-acetyltransferase [Comamonadaceae bacterium]|nr:GNAT family N-acetyltransferase [Comamonadaceae bacterium]